VFLLFNFARLILAILVANVLAACNLKAHLPSFDDPVSFTVVMHEDGWCEASIFNREVEKKHVTKFGDYRSPGKPHFIGCKEPTPGDFSKLEVVVGVSSVYHDTPLPIEFSKPGASRETHILQPSDDVLVSVEAQGKGSLGSFFCAIRLRLIDWTFVVNTGQDRKHHILTGTGIRECTFG